MEAGVHFGHGTRKWNLKCHLIYLQSIRLFILQILLELLGYYQKILVFHAENGVKQILIVSTTKRLNE